MGPGVVVDHGFPEGARVNHLIYRVYRLIDPTQNCFKFRIIIGNCGEGGVRPPLLVMLGLEHLVPAFEVNTGVEYGICSSSAIFIYSPPVTFWRISGEFIRRIFGDVRAPVSLGCLLEFSAPVRARFF